MQCQCQGRDIARQRGLLDLPVKYYVTSSSTSYLAHQVHLTWGIFKYLININTQSTHEIRFRIQRVWATTKAIGSSTRGPTSTLETSQLQSQHVTTVFGVEQAGSFCALFLPLEQNMSMSCQLCFMLLQVRKPSHRKQAERSPSAKAVNYHSAPLKLLGQSAVQLRPWNYAKWQDVIGFKQTVWCHSCRTRISKHHGTIGLRRQDLPSNRCSHLLWHFSSVTMRMMRMWVWWNRIPTPLSAASCIVAVLLTFTGTCYTRAGSLNLQRSKTYQLIEPGIDIYQQKWHRILPESQQAGAASPSGSLRKSLSSTLISTCAASMPGVCGLWMTIRPFLLRLVACRAVSNPVSPCVYSIQSIFIDLITSPLSLPSLPLPDLPLSNLALSDLPLSNLDLSLSNSVLPD